MSNRYVTRVISAKRTVKLPQFTIDRLGLKIGEYVALRDMCMGIELSYFGPNRRYLLEEDPDYWTSDYPIMRASDFLSDEELAGFNRGHVKDRVYKLQKTRELSLPVEHMEASSFKVGDTVRVYEAGLITWDED